MTHTKLLFINVGFFIFFAGFLIYNFYPETKTVNNLKRENLVEPTPTPTPVEDRLLPDLQVLFPDTLFIQISPNTGKKEIRFNSKVVNLGEGSLEMAGMYDEKEKKTKATQIIHKKDGTLIERVVGHFVFHPTHNHWHFEDFIEFELYTYKKDKSLGKRLLTTGKITSCIYDSYIVSPRPPNTPDIPLFPNCESGKQGITMGWVDNYGAGVPGQYLDIENIPDGNYALQITVDPLKRILESNRDNNSARVYVEIKGMNIEMIPNQL